MNQEPMREPPCSLIGGSRVEWEQTQSRSSLASDNGDQNDTITEHLIRHFHWIPTEILRVYVCKLYTWECGCNQKEEKTDFGDGLCVASMVHRGEREHCVVENCNFAVAGSISCQDKGI